MNFEFKDEVHSKYKIISSFKEGMANVMLKNDPSKRQGCIDLNGSEVIPCEYAYVSEFNSGLAHGHKDTTDYVIINKKGNIAIPDEYDSVRNFSEGLATVYKDYKAGVIDEKGNVVIPFKYLGIGKFKDGLASASMDLKNSAGYIDREGNEIIPFVFDHTFIFCNGLGCAKKDNKWYLVNSSGNISKAYDYVFLFDDGHAIVKDEGKRVIVNNNFEVIRTLSDEYELENSNPVPIASLWYKKEGKYGYILSNITIPPIFKSIKFSNKFSFLLNCFVNDFSDGVAIGELSEDLIGIVDRNCKITTFSKQQYLEINNFHDGLGAVKNPEGLWGYIDLDGNEVIPCKYEDAFDFSEGLALVVENGIEYFIDKKGIKKFQLPMIYKSTFKVDDNVEHCIMAESEEELLRKKLRCLEIFIKTSIQNEDVDAKSKRLTL